MHFLSKAQAGIQVDLLIPTTEITSQKRILGTCLYWSSGLHCYGAGPKQHVKQHSWDLAWECPKLQETIFYLQCNVLQTVKQVKLIFY